MQLLLKTNQFIKTPLTRISQFTKNNLLNQPSLLASSPYYSFSACKKTTDNQCKKSCSLFGKLFGKESLIASEKFDNPAVMFIPALLTHMSIGAVWSWSFVSANIIKEVGFVAQAAADWSFKLASMPMSFIFSAFGLSSALLGTLMLKIGPRKAIGLAALSFSSGFALGALGIHLHNIMLLNFGFGIFGGIGIGISYTPAIATLMRWYPHKMGLASGMTIAGFGLAPLLFTPVMQALMKHFVKFPQYLGKVADVTTQYSNGRLFADVGGQLKEVIIANSADLAQLPYKELQEGVYVAGTGNTGAAVSFAIMGAIYGSFMLTASLIIKYPHPTIEQKYKNIAQQLLQAQSKSAAIIKRGNVQTLRAIKSPQFLLMFATFVMYGTTAMALFSTCKPLMNEIFSAKLPNIVDAQFASTFISLLSIGSVIGRVFWGALSEKLGRKNTIILITTLAIGCFGSIPAITKMLVASNSSLPLWMFIASTIFVSSCQGGLYSIVPPYEADLFGNKYLTPIHGVMLTNLMITSFFGPNFIQYMKSKSESQAIQDLLKQVDQEKFVNMFKCGVDQADQLIQSKALTISKLMNVVPATVQDPSPFLYNSSMYCMCGMMLVSLVAVSGIFPIKPSMYEDYKDTKADEKKEIPKVARKEVPKFAKKVENKKKY